MRLLLIFSIAVMFLSGCNDNDLIAQKEIHKEPTKNNHGMQMVSVGSRDELQNLINSLGMPGSPQSRSQQSTLNFTNNDLTFVSLVEANKRKVMDSLSPAQLDSILNDEDELAFWPEDSVIADIHFAQLLNAERRIEVNDTIFEFHPNGVVFVPNENAKLLDDLDSLVSIVDVTPQNAGVKMSLKPGVDFIPVKYAMVPTDIPIYGESGNMFVDPPHTGSSDSEGIHLSGGVEIPLSDIREIEFKNNWSGDGNWFHKLASGLFGANVVAINKFNNHKKLTLHFYDQNYIVYANIGVSVKLQKKVCGFWWNMKAEDIVLGWEPVTIRYELPAPYFDSPFQISEFDNPTVSTPFNCPYNNEEITLFRIPFTNYDITNRHFNKAFKAGFEYLMNTISDHERKKMSDGDKMAFMTHQGCETFIIHAPHSLGAKNERQLESKFYAKRFAGKIKFCISFGSKVSYKIIDISTNDGVDIYSGRVFGAAKYKGKWLGARITKNPG